MQTEVMSSPAKESRLGPMRASYQGGRAALAAPHGSDPREDQA